MKGLQSCLVVALLAPAVAGCAGLSLGRLHGQIFLDPAPVQEVLVERRAPLVLAAPSGS